MSLGSRWSRALVPLPRIILTIGLPATVMGACTRAASDPHAVRFDRIHELRPGEGVYAYARISPDGRRLVYASETKDSTRHGALSQMVTVVDLAQRKIVFTEPGLDAAWAPDGERIIYEDLRAGRYGVSIWNGVSKTITRDVASAALGDYFSWGRRAGKDLILTIDGQFYYLDGDRAVLPPTAIKPCDGIGVGERPLLSKNGRQVTAFVRGTVVVRNLTDCDDIVDTRIRGAKADFSWDGRYIAFHAAKATGAGYEINIVDLRKRTVRRMTDLPGSSLFPNWTRDGRLCFLYDGDGYRGFMMATDVLALPAYPLPTSLQPVQAMRAWSDIFPETVRPSRRWNLVLVWSTWSAHSAYALTSLQEARAWFHRAALDVGVMTAAEPGSKPEDIRPLEMRYQIALPRIPLAAQRLALTDADNQVPTTLLFRDGQLVDRRLGAQSFGQLKNWVLSRAVADHATKASGQP